MLALEIFKKVLNNPVVSSHMVLKTLIQFNKDYDKEIVRKATQMVFDIRPEFIKFIINEAAKRGMITVVYSEISKKEAQELLIKKFVQDAESSGPSMN